MHKLLLTFDVEDVVSKNSIWILHQILERLKQYNLRAIFFLTGHMAEKLEKIPAILDLLDQQEIGYHSSSHSVHPTIFEFTDVNNYEKARQISVQRETSHINPLTGNIEGNGGIYALHDLFRKKNVESFRAPGFCWSPPHLEALRSLGIRYDFSANVHSEPVHHKGITFYPKPLRGYVSRERALFCALKRATTVMVIHPSFLVNREEWDSVYFRGNPKELVSPPTRNPEAIARSLKRLTLLLKQIRTLEKMSLIDSTLDIRDSSNRLTLKKRDFDKCFESAINWPVMFFKYEPRYLYSHFLRFFEVGS